MGIIIRHSVRYYWANYSRVFSEVLRSTWAMGIIAGYLVKCYRVVIQWVTIDYEVIAVIQWARTSDFIAGYSVCYEVGFIAGYSVRCDVDWATSTGQIIAGYSVRCYDRHGLWEL